MSKNNKIKKSAFAEFSKLSGFLVVLFSILFIISIALYIFIAIPPEKTSVVKDDAGLLSRDEVLYLEDYAEDISRKKDINVIIVTTDEKGRNYSNSEQGSEAFASDQYSKLARTSVLKDDSGILLLIDMELRYYFIYTYGTVHASITNSECERIAQAHVSLLQSDRHFDALESTLGEVESYNYRSVALILLYIGYFVLPMLIVVIVAWVVVRRKRSKITVDYSTYKDQSKSKIIEERDEFVRQTVTVTYASSSSGGGGGGGRSGGGGARF